MSNNLLSVRSLKKRFGGLEAVNVDILASATVPVKLPAGILVNDAPDPEKVVAVITPDVTLIPLEKVTAALPSSPFISVTLISDMFIEYFIFYLGKYSQDIHHECCSCRYMKCPTRCNIYLT